jgi:hypothetical protein
MQGWFKFGGVEFFKIQAVTALGEQAGWDNRNVIYLGSSAAAEFIADIFLCPLEATRIRLVSNPTYASSMVSAMTKMASEEGMIGAFYSGFGPILAKQVRTNTSARVMRTEQLRSAPPRHTARVMDRDDGRWTEEASLGDFGFRCRTRWPSSLCRAWRRRTCTKAWARSRPSATAPPIYPFRWDRA